MPLPLAITLLTQNPPPQATTVRSAYTKMEAMIPMRDGARLYTAIYVPKSTSEKWPILMTRTPYGVGSYGADRYARGLGPGAGYQEKGYIFVSQDVRGRWMSEGTHVYSPPPNPNRKGTEHDESTDAYDTVEHIVG